MEVCCLIGTVYLFALLLFNIYALKAIFDLVCCVFQSRPIIDLQVSYTVGDLLMLDPV